MIGQLVSHDILLGRWRFALDLFGRVFCDDVGMESGSVISELGGFPVKESKFRREMEKIRNPQQRDLTLEVGGATGLVCGVLQNICGKLHKVKERHKLQTSGWLHSNRPSKILENPQITNRIFEGTPITCNISHVQSKTPKFLFLIFFQLVSALL